MDDNDSFLFRRHEDAKLKIEYYLAKNANFFRLDNNLYCGLNAWKTEYTNSEKTWEIHIIFPIYYPDELPKIKINNDTNLFLKNPHIDEEGYLCIVPNTSSYDSDDIIPIFEYLIDSTKKILDGTDVSDFKDEFESYWNRNISPHQKICVLISSPEDSEKKYHAFIGKKLICISSSKDKLLAWLNNFCSMDINDFTERECFVLRMNTPLSPSEYPNSIYDVLEIAKKYYPDMHNELAEFITHSDNYCFILLVQKNSNKYSLGGILLFGLYLSKKQKLSNGFRIGHVPSNILIHRACSRLKETLINRCKINRVDHNWIHSRGGDGKIFDKNKIVLLGCGSLGGYLAHYLAKTGIGNIIVIDKEYLEFSNIGRHILGGDSVENYKSIELEQKLKKEMPHLFIKGIASDWRDCYNKDDSLFKTADLIISTMAEWRSEKPLNLLARSMDFPPVVYAWLEPFAIAGHCFISVPKSRCIECQMDSKGIFKKRVGIFGDNILQRESGTCTYYQEYGPSALMPILSMIISEIISLLSNPLLESKLSTWISDEKHLSNVNAKITEEWRNKINISGYSKIYHEIVAANKGCKACTKI